MTKINLFTIVFCITILSCNQNESSNQPVQQTGEVTVAETTEVESYQINDAALQAVFSHYDKLSAALVAKDAETARVVAHTITEAAGSIEGLAFMLEHAKAIAASDNLATQRKHYSTLSNSIIEKIKNAGMKAGVLYIDFCPMALNDNGGYWLSIERKVVNPYYGDEMLNCGSIADSIVSY